ncbi:hypothetical protein KM043_006850 [Ampulex compressa]|nr:hypothetical protein KM043_006850 [Ampulex compressa]
MEAYGCLSSQNTKIDGKEISLFPFPEDDTIRKQWLQNCKLTDTSEDGKAAIHICELHFEEMSFTTSGELKSTAVPTIFGKVEADIQRKRKAESALQIGSSRTPPLKQKKLDDESHSLVTPPQSPFMHIREHVDLNDECKMDLTQEHELAINGSSTPKSDLYRHLEMGKKIYRLTIQIDKMFGMSDSTPKKLVSLLESDKNKREFSINTNDIDQKYDMPQNLDIKGVCPRGTCKLRRSVYESKAAYQCEYCDKYYVTKKSSRQTEKNNSCSVCHKFFPNPQMLCSHVKKHFSCDMCETECSSQITFDRHARLHVSTDPLYPYKCHQCTEIFELKEDLRQHYLIVHPTIKLQNTILQMTASPITPQLSQQKDYRCVSCNITFRNEQAYRNHVNSHKKKEGLRCNISETNNIFPVPNPLTGSQIGTYLNVRQLFSYERTERMAKEDISNAIFITNKYVFL